MYRVLEKIRKEYGTKKENPFAKMSKEELEKKFNELKQKHELSEKIALEKYEKNKELVEKYNKNKASIDELKIFTTQDIAILRNMNIINKPFEKTDYDVYKEKAEVFASKLSPEDLKLRKEMMEFYKEYVFTSGFCWTLKDGTHVTGYGIDELFKVGKKLGKKYPAGKVKRVLLPEEFQRIQGVLYNQE